MHQIKKYISRNTYVFLTTMALVFSLVFALVIYLFFGMTQTIDQTSVGHIYLGNQPEARHDEILNREINLWIEQADYRLVYQDYTYDLDLSHFTYDGEETLLRLVANERNVAFFELDVAAKAALSAELDAYFTDTFMAMIDIDRLFSDIQDAMGQLLTIKHFRLYDYFLEDQSRHLLGNVILTNLTEADVDAIIDQTETFAIRGNARFSLLTVQSGTTLDNDQLSIIASGLLHLIGPTHLSGIITQNQQTVPVYGDVGMNVRILRINQYDLTFFNTYDYPLTVDMVKVNATTLEMRLLGYPYLTTYTVTMSVMSTLPFVTTTVFDGTLGPTTPGVDIIEDDDTITYRVLTQTGVDGQYLYFFRTIDRLHDDAVTVKIHEELYWPQPTIYRERIVDKEDD